jgi:hypothetical protein
VTAGRISDDRRDDKGRMLTKARTREDTRFTKGRMRKDRRVDKRKDIRGLRQRYSTAISAGLIPSGNRDRY